MNLSCNKPMLGDFALLLTPSLLVKRASIQLHLRNLHWMYWTPGKLVPVSPIFIALAALAAACIHSRAGVQATVWHSDAHTMCYDAHLSPLKLSTEPLQRLNRRASEISNETNKSAPSSAGQSQTPGVLDALHFYG